MTTAVTWRDDLMRTRLFKAATRVSAHFYEAADRTTEESQSAEQVERLNQRWQMVADTDRTVAEYVERFEKELLVLKGEAIFDHIRTQLAKPFACEERLSHLNKKALEQARKCATAWGGTRAKRRVKELKALPLHVESTAQEQTKISFERQSEREPHILTRAGSPKLLLYECMILEFSLFHEYLSHAFPSWQKDVEEISEGWLFALEFDWFESQYTLLDDELLESVWQGRFGKDRRGFRAGRWLLKRCKSRDCVRKFLLEWVAGWDGAHESDNLDLLSQLQGVYVKAGRKFGVQKSSKRLKTLEILDASLCSGCEGGVWDIADMTKKLRTSLDAYRGAK
jgi:hypothetical protein